MYLIPISVLKKTHNFDLWYRMKSGMSCLCRNMPARGEVGIFLGENSNNSIIKGTLIYITLNLDNRVTAMGPLIRTSTLFFTNKIWKHFLLLLLWQFYQLIGLLLLNAFKSLPGLDSNIIYHYILVFYML